MGIFSVPIEVGDQQGHRYIPLQALVDTGSSHTSIPQDVLNQLETLPRGLRRHRLADDSIVNFPWGEARVRLMGVDISVVVVFLPLGTEPLLGASTLGSFGLAVDPINERLIEVDQLLKRL